MANDKEQKKDEFDQLNFDQPLYQGTLEEQEKKAATPENDADHTDDKTGDEQSVEPDKTITQDETTERQKKSVVRPVHTTEEDTFHKPSFFRSSQYDDDLDMDTTEVTTIWRDYPRGAFAGFWIRVVAYLVDFLMVNALTHTLLNLLAVIGITIFTGSAAETVASYIVAILYFTLFTYFTNGYTIGKALFGLRTVSLDGETLSFMTCLAREGIGKMLLIKLNLLGLVVLFTRHHENFMDFFTETSVINARVIRTAEQMPHHAHYAKESL
ncbi:MAG: RDD family protein [Aerococcus sp.]|nr:RDD family protein [Aerococcus sp.]